MCMLTHVLLWHLIVLYPAHCNTFCQGSALRTRTNWAGSICAAWGNWSSILLDLHMIYSQQFRNHGWHGWYSQGDSEIDCWKTMIDSINYFPLMITQSHWPYCYVTVRTIRNYRLKSSISLTVFTILNHSLIVDWQSWLTMNHHYTADITIHLTSVKL